MKPMEVGDLLKVTRLISSRACETQRVSTTLIFAVSTPHNTRKWEAPLLPRKPGERPSHSPAHLSDEVVMSTFVLSSRFP